MRERSIATTDGGSRPAAAGAGAAFCPPPGPTAFVAPVEWDSLAHPQPLELAGLPEDAREKGKPEDWRRSATPGLLFPDVDGRIVRGGQFAATLLNG